MICGETFRLLRMMVICATICICLIGTASQLPQIAKPILDMKLDSVLAILLVLGVGGGTLPAVKKILGAIGREHRRTKELEQIVDPERDSSGLTEDGELPEG